MLKVAIIGAGAISAEHIKGYLEFQHRCELVAISDIYPDKAEEKIAQFGLKANVFKDYKELLASCDVDLVSICTPPYTHAAIAVDALNAGKHVLVEKPMASSLEECDAMNEAAMNNDKLLSVVAQNRFTTPMMKFKHVQDKNLIGKILHTQVDSFWWRGHSYYDLWWRGTWEKEGGGCTLNHAVHHIDLFLWMNGMPAEITAIMSNTAHDNAEVEDLSIAIAKYSNGSLAQITSSVVHHGQEQQLIFQGELARISVPWKVSASSSLENGFPVENNELTKEIEQTYNEFDPLKHEGHNGQIDNVLTAIEENKPVLISGIDGRQTLEFITAIYEAASLGKMVTLPLTTDSPFYTREGVLKHATRFYEKTTSIENFTKTDITLGRKF